MSDEDSGKDSPRYEEGKDSPRYEEDHAPENNERDLMESSYMGDSGDAPAAAPSASADGDAAAAPSAPAVAGDGKKVTIYVGEIHGQVTEADIRELFEKKGKLVRCDVKEKAKRPRYCFVEYEDDAVAEDVLKEFEKNPPTINGHTLKVERANGRRELSCFNCKKPGHKAAECPEAPRRSGPRHSRGEYRRKSSSRGRSHSRSRSRSHGRGHSRHSHSRHYRHSHSRSRSRSRSRSGSRDRYSHGRHSDRDRDHDRDRDRGDRDRDRDHDRDRDSDRRSSRHEERRSSRRDSSVHDRHRSHSGSRSRSPRR